MSAITAERQAQINEMKVLIGSNISDITDDALCVFIDYGEVAVNKVTAIFPDIPSDVAAKAKIFTAAHFWQISSDGTPDSRSSGGVGWQKQNGYGGESMSDFSSTEFGRMADWLLSAGLTSSKEVTIVRMVTPRSSFRQSTEERVDWYEVYRTAYNYGGVRNGL